jgi:hypothetical protein
MLKLFFEKFWECFSKVGISITVIALVAIILQEVPTINSFLLLSLGIIFIIASSIILTLTEKE